ncbi:MAG TPA: hypothetical protein VGK19_21925 [Capsulimonadaceae bacterium]|jgi:spermidine synthase
MNLKIDKKAKRRAASSGQVPVSTETDTTNPSANLIIAAYLVSGICALAYETIWIRIAALRIGGTVVSATLVIAAFFLCAALGNLIGGVLSRKGHAVRAFGLVELLCALTAAVLYIAEPSIASVVAARIGGELSAHVAYVLLLAGMPALLAGASFPLAAQAAVATLGTRTSRGGVLYGANLVGAALGIVGGGVLLPMVAGNRAALLVAAATEIIVGALLIVKAKPAVASREESQLPKLERTVYSRFGVVIAISSGALSILLEVLVISYAHQIVQDSVFTVAATLFAFILCLGAGSLIAARLRRKGVAVELLMPWALLLSGVLVALYIPVLAALIGATVTPPGPGLWDYASGLITFAVVALSPLLVCVGMVFPLAWELCETSLTSQGQALGRLSSMNKAASAVGAILGPFVLVPIYGLAGAMVHVAVAYAFLGTVFLLRHKRLTMIQYGGLGFAIFVGHFVSWYVKTPIVLVDGETLLARYEGGGGTVAVTRDSVGSHHIVLNQTYTLNGTERGMLSQQQEAWLPLALTPAPRRVAFIGMASGVSANAVLDFPVEHLDAIELNPQVEEAARNEFGQWNARLYRDPRSRVIVNDGRYVVEQARQPYDTIICTLLLPSQEGTASLYSHDFFESVRRKLAPNGRFCLWLPTYQMDKALEGIVVRTFVDAFPSAIMVRASFSPDTPAIGLIGSNEPLDMSDAFIRQRLASVPAIGSVSPFFRSPDNFRLALMGDIKGKASDFAANPTTTDDRPVFAFQGPLAIAPTSALRGFALLDVAGKGYQDGPFPSLAIGTDDRARVTAGIRAGNYFYAASSVGFPERSDLVEGAKQHASVLQYMGTARSYSRSAKVTESDLGH